MLLSHRIIHEGAGYHGSTKDSGNRAFDPLNIGKGPAPPLAEKSENSHEDKAKEMEKVWRLWHVISKSTYIGLLLRLLSMI